MLWYSKHLNLCHRTEKKKQLKRKADPNWNILDPYPHVEGWGVKLWNSEKSGVENGHLKECLVASSGYYLRKILVDYSLKTYMLTLQECFQSKRLKKRLREKGLSSAGTKWIFCKFYLLSLLSPLQIHIIAFFLCHEWVLTYHKWFYGPGRVQNVTSIDYRLHFTIHCF